MPTTPTPKNLSDTVSKFDLILEKIEAIQTTQNLRFANLETSLIKLEETGEESRRALRGSNGDVGLVGTVNNLISRVREIERSVDELTKQVMEQGKLVKTHGAHADSSRTQKEEIIEIVKEATSEDHVVRWSTVRDKTLWPLILIAILGLAFLLGQQGLIHP